MDKIINKIIAETETFIYQDYLNKLVSNISLVLELEYVFIARTNLENNISSAIAVSKNGTLVENFEYSLEDTPCEDVIENSICYFNDVSKAFPNDKLLSDMNIDGYVGSKLNDSDDNVVGIFVGLSEKPIKNIDYVISIMKIFSGRIIAEFDRMDKEQELKKINNELNILNKSLEEKVKLATFDLKRAQNLAKIGSWRYNIQEDILDWSDETYNIFQIDKVSNPIKTLDDFFTTLDTEYVEIVNKEYDKHLKNNTPYEIIHELILKDGTSKWIKEKCETRFDEYGTPLVSNGVLQDITEERKKDKFLQQQSRLAQMGEMISMIAHQWRQPLGAIAATTVDLKIQSELQKFNLEDVEEAKDYEVYVNDGLDKVSEFVQSLTDTIDDFRNFLKPDKQADFILFDEPVKKALSIIKGSFKSDGIDIEIVKKKCVSCNHKTKMYSGEIMQVILNILKNSQDNFKEKEIKNPKITIGCDCNIDKKIILKIFDNGGGIDKDIIGKIFNPYFSTKDEKNGTGLGLYMSKVIIEEHHKGKFFVDNIDDGACFIIELGEF